MNLRTNGRKFREHLKAGGFFYAGRQGVKYFIFLVRKNLGLPVINFFLSLKIRIRKRAKKVSKPGITYGRTRIEVTTYGVKIYWQDKEITERVGLNAAINIFGLWTDSSKADWKIQKAKEHIFVLECRWWNLPLVQRWIVKFESEAKILWDIEMEVEEDLEIDQRRAVMFVSPKYKTWISSYEQGDFPQMDSWRGIYLSNPFSDCVGVRFPQENEVLPSLLLKFKENPYGRMRPLIQNVPKEINSYLVGAEIIDESEKKYFLPGKYKFFQGEITLFENERILDAEVEKFRRRHLLKIKRKKLFKGKKLNVFLANMPWRKEDCWGVRAGSRWPHIKDISEGKYLPFPFFLSYAASLLKEDGFEVKIIDALAEEMPEEQFLKEVNKVKPDLMVAEVSTVSLENDLELLKKIPGDISIVICGPDVNIRTPGFLKTHSFINYVLAGEYEWTLLELVQQLSRDKDLKNVRGLIYREKGDIKVNAFRPLISLDSLPWPLREELPMYKYWDLPGNIPFPSVQMLASRGCPFRCIFCLWPQVMYQGSFYRARNPVNVADEMEYLVKVAGFKSVYFDDDTWNIGRERMLTFCGELKRRNLTNIPWAIMARPDLMDEKLLEDLKKSGLWAVKYGVESGVQELVNNANKNMDLIRAEKMIEETKKLGIKVHLTFTFGLPGETQETIKKTTDYAIRMNPESIQFSIVTPFPGTDYFTALDKVNNITTKNWSDYDGNYRSVIKLDSLSSHDLENAKNRAYLLWGEHQRKRRGVFGNAKKFKKYAEEDGLSSALNKVKKTLRFAQGKPR